jgi:CO/xanthine dehydrogenase FAD-binding subunit
MLDAKGRVEDARVGITGVCAVPYRARAAEESLRGRVPDARAIAEAASAAVPAEGAEVLSDLHASAEYRRELTAIFTRRSLERAAARARK